MSETAKIEVEFEGDLPEEMSDEFYGHIGYGIIEAVKRGTKTIQFSALKGLDSTDE